METSKSNADRGLNEAFLAYGCLNGGQLEGLWMEILQFGLGHMSVHFLSFDVETSCDWVKCRLLRFGVSMSTVIFFV